MMSTNTYLQESSTTLAELALIPKHKVNNINHSVDDVVYLLRDLTSIIDDHPSLKEQIRTLSLKNKINHILDSYEFLGSQNTIPYLVFTNQNVTYLEEKISENIYFIYVSSIQYNIDFTIIGACIDGNYYINTQNKYQFEKFNK